MYRCISVYANAFVTTWCHLCIYVQLFKLTLWFVASHYVLAVCTVWHDQRDLKIGRSLKENGSLEADIFNIPHCLSQSPSTISSFSLSLSLFDPSHRVAFSPCVQYDTIRDCCTCNKLENWSKFEEKRISRCWYI